MTDSRQIAGDRPNSSPAAAQPGPLARRWLAAMSAVASRLAVGRLELVLPDGREKHFDGAQPGPTGRVLMQNWRLPRRFLTGGAMGFCESYLDGDWESDDLTGVCHLSAANRLAIAETLTAPGWRRTLRQGLQRLRPNTRRGSRRNIAAHYDLGNRFYQAWLDSSMTYSAAVFDAGVDDLESAQRAKYAALADRLDIRPGHHVLEIGCGWGGFAAYLAQVRGAYVTAVTISEAQQAYAARRIQEAGLSERVTIELVDYRDVDGQFDRIASIEMLEAVGESHWPVFFDTLGRRLAPGGRAALQVITIADRLFPSYRRNQDFIQRHVFPGGLLPSPAALRAHAASAGLAVKHWRDFGQDYARTLAHWQERFQAAWPRLADSDGFDQRFKRLWDLYLAYCRGGFQAGAINVAQFALEPA